MLTSQATGCVFFFLAGRFPGETKGKPQPFVGDLSMLDLVFNEPPDKRRFPCYGKRPQLANLAEGSL